MIDTKDFKTIDEQIKILFDRKLIIDDVDEAKRILSQTNYFDLINGFETIFLKSRNPKEYENMHFDDFYNAYKFDNNLKHFVLAAIFNIESRLRTSISYHFAELYCRTAPDTLNYIDRRYYNAPNPTDSYLTKKWNEFSLFRPTLYNRGNPTLGIRRRCYLDEIKDDYPYLNSYIRPPFWITIKTLTLGSLYFMYIFLKDDVKKLVLKDFGMSLSDDIAFKHALYILKEARNECAHLELISRIRIDQSRAPELLSNGTVFFGLSHTDKTFLDVLKVLDYSTNTTEIKRIIKQYIRRNKWKKRKHVTKRMLSKMGNSDQKIWKNI